MFLNRIPAEEIGYGILLCTALCIGVGGFEFYRYRGKYHRMQELEKSIKVSLQDMPEPEDVIEAEYRKYAEILFDGKAEMETEAIRRERDMREYYTMWVHQIKTPIAALKLLLQENSGDAELTAERTEELQELFRIEQYVEMALQYMRLGSESTDFVLKKVELDSVIREAVHKYARQFISRKISLKYEAVNQAVVTDEKWLEFVIEQLLSNAIKYTPKGSISIWVEESTTEAVCEENAADKEITTSVKQSVLNGEKEKKAIRLVIEDTGIGIRADDLPRVCEKGYTGYNGHADKRSTGIGLYLCSSILKKLNHTLRIESKEGVGTKVIMEFLKE